jgi:hypothetical protein
MLAHQLLQEGKPIHARHLAETSSGTCPAAENAAPDFLASRPEDLE